MQIIYQGFHDEALELAHFVNGLEKRHILATTVRSNDTAFNNTKFGCNVVQSIVDDVHLTLVNLRQQLLNLLTENVSLAREIQILSTLRKLDSLLLDRQFDKEKRDNDNIFISLNDQQREILKQNSLLATESKLQMDFLEARTIWLQKLIEKTVHGDENTLSNIKKSNLLDDNSSNDNNITSARSIGPHSKAIEIIEVHRAAWHSIVSQFQSLFEVNCEGVYSSNSILSSWSTNQANMLLHELCVLLPSIDDGSSIRQILEQTLFLGNRMGQVGCDIVGLIIPIFKNSVGNKVVSEWTASLSQFKNMLATENFFYEADDLTSKEQMIPLFMPNENSTGDITGIGNKKVNDEITPSTLLLSYPPLSYFFNAIMKGLNVLRECPILTLKDFILNKLSIILDDAVLYFTNISQDIRVRGAKYLISNKNKTKDSQEFEYLDIMYSHAMVHEFLPTILLCYDIIYCTPSSKVINILSKNNVELQDKLSVESFQLYSQLMKYFEKNKLL